MTSRRTFLQGMIGVAITIAMSVDVLKSPVLEADKFFLGGNRSGKTYAGFFETYMQRIPWIDSMLYEDYEVRP